MYQKMSLEQMRETATRTNVVEPFKLFLKEKIENDFLQNDLMSFSSK
jgi:hypothetical protein